nr:reverse transcriptase domain-containing protein [Tanacetum cinerariifolium]
MYSRVLTIIENKSKVRNSRNKSVVSQVKSSDANSNSSFEIAKLTHAVNQQISAVTTAMTAILKQFQATPPSASVKAVEEICVTCVGAHPYYQCLTAGGNTFPELRDNIQGSLPSNTIANTNGELKAITTRSGIVLDGPSVPIPPPFIKDQDLAEYTIKKMFKALLSNKEKLLELANTPLNENCSAVILKKLPEKLRDPGKFLILCGFNELKCKALADLGASINLMPLSVWKKLGLPELISIRMTLELANRAICTPARIARDVFTPVGKFTFPANFVIVDYESDPRVPFIMGRPFLWTARALIDVHGEKMILRDGDERLTLNMRHDTSSYSNQPQRESINLINVFNDSRGDILHEKLLDLDSTKDLHPPHHVNPLSGSTTFSSSPNQLLEEFADELTLITFPPGNDYLQFDIESDLKEIEYLLHHDPIKDIDSILKDSIDQIKSDTKNVYDDPFDSKREKIKESKLLTDELDLPCEFLLPFEYDSFLSKDFFEDDALPSTNNEDKETFDPPLYELHFFKEVPRTTNNSVKLEVKAKQGLFGNPKSSYVQFVSFSHFEMHTNGNVVEVVALKYKEADVVNNIEAIVNKSAK